MRQRRGKTWRREWDSNHPRRRYTCSVSSNEITPPRLLGRRGRIRNDNRKRSSRRAVTPPHFLVLQHPPKHPIEMGSFGGGSGIRTHGTPRDAQRFSRTVEFVLSCIFLCRPVLSCPGCNSVWCRPVSSCIVLFRTVWFAARLHTIVPAPIDGTLTG